MKVMARYGPPLVFIALLLIALELISRGFGLERWLPAPSRVGIELVHGLADGEFSSQLGVTLGTFALGFGIAVALAIVAGILMGTVTFIHDALIMAVDFLRPVPSVAMIPLAILFFGLGETMRLAMVVYAAFWPMLVNVIYGVRAVDPVNLDVARNFGIDGPARLALIVLPASLGAVATGIRVSAAIALSVTVTVELVVGDSGLGFAITQAEQADRVAAMYAAIVLTGLIGWGLNALLARAERAWIFWSPAARASA